MLSVFVIGFFIDSANTPFWWLNVFYAPVFVGLYMILLHTVVHGWRFRKSRAGISGRRGRFGRRKSSSLKSNLISYSMMKFQGKQTVNNMLVSTVLIAGACFAIFYLPMLTSSMTGSLKNRPYDYLYHYRADQRGMGQREVEKLASEYGISLKDWHETDYISLGMDGMADVGEGGKIEYQYREMFCEGKFFSESGFRELTGKEVRVKEGGYLAVSNEEETNEYTISTNSTVLTNMTTRETMPVNFAGLVHCDMLADNRGCYVLNDADYTEIAEGAEAEWFGIMRGFNVDGEDSYQFADRFLHLFAESFDERGDISCFYDRVEKAVENEQGRAYWGDEDDTMKIDLDRINDTDFRLYWEYMPKSVILEETDFMRTFAVFLMMFLFIFLICVTAACVICYTRCQTIALNNRYVFENLKKLGASPAFLEKEIRRQCCTVIRTPSVIGIAAMSLLYTMIMFGNDGKLTGSEMAGLGRCSLVILGIAALLYIVYYGTVKVLVRELADMQ